MNPDARDPQPIYGERGVLRDDGDKVQCHVSGEWFCISAPTLRMLVGPTPGAYRRRFDRLVGIGLMASGGEVVRYG